MGLWIGENLPALLFGAGFGAAIAELIYPQDYVWVLGSLAGIGFALPIWQVNKDRWMNHDH